MTTTGPTTGEQPDQPAAARPRRRLPRTLALIGLLVTAAAGGTWAEVHFAGRIQLDHQALADGSSQDSAGAQQAITGLGVGGAGETQVDEILPLKVDFPGTATSPDGYRGTRYALSARTTDCGAVFADAATVSVTKDCAGYLTAAYVRETDHALYSSVTVLYYPDPATATRVARLLNVPQTALADLRFVQPGNGLPATEPQTTGAPTTGAPTGGTAPTRSGSSQAGAGAAGLPLSGTVSSPPSATTTPTPGSTPTGGATQKPLPRDPDPAATEVRVAAVGRAVTIVQSTFADGRAITPELDTPTWYLSYTVATALAWEPDQAPATAGPTP